MQYVLFENPFVLVPILIVLAYVCLVVWLRRRTVRAKRALLVALLLCVILPIVQKLVVTSREELREVCSEMVQAAEAGDVPGIGVHVAESFREGDIDRDKLLNAARRSLEYYDVQEAKLKSVDAEVEGNRAVVNFTVSVHVQTPDWPTQQSPTTWTAKFELMDGRWQLTAISPRETFGFPFESLRQIIR